MHTIRRSLFALVVLSAGFLMASPSAATRATTPVAPVAAATTSTPAPAEGKLLADEIVRRLRRLGVNFVRTRLARPYDPLGEIC